MRDAAKVAQDEADERARLSKHRTSPKASVTVGPFTFLWLDKWVNLYGLDFEVRVGRRVYCLALGFGQGFRAWRGYA